MVNYLIMSGLVFFTFVVIFKHRGLPEDDAMIATQIAFLFGLLWPAVILFSAGYAYIHVKPSQINEIWTFFYGTIRLEWWLLQSKIREYREALSA